MNYTIKKLPKSQIELSVTVTEKELLRFEEEALGEIAQKMHIEGFRPGKASEKLIKEKIDTEEITARGVEKAVQKYYREIVEKENLDLIGSPDAKIIQHSPELIFTAIATVFPLITLPDYKTIAQKINSQKKSLRVEEKEITDAIEWLRESRATRITVSREARNGDDVEIDFEVTHNGVLVEGGSSKNHPVIIGKNAFIPGFEQELIGMKEKDQKTFSLTASENYPHNLGGKKLDFKVTMNLAQERIIPELSDDFIKGIGNFASIDALRDSISEGLLNEKEIKEKDRLSMLTAESIGKATIAEVPDILIERELDKMLAELKNGIGRMGMNFEGYLEHLKKTSDDLRKEWKADADKRVKIALALRMIAEKEHLEPTPEEVSAKANNSLEMFRNEGHNIQKIDQATLTEYSKSILRNEKVFEFLRIL